ncbi:LOW QUALITY PROTEIN: protein ENDOSPERM DEFECTIVE 1-like [Juglans microcarpa x Juglans regia]|uniref:LOW QUALITY PROTEIN: protein ENDOSPERM DEFECTIVE 1-like n=1 Tax=Juglans microcarpa x Juglans regia TaxID=2249226 RepID=UPI001B7EBF5A|nr:LOW QUALITY PROTEIN: protein ENDOSPERM DEFECTIVE 1-like [Juglans microcarpa x Juglans regia]
MNESMQQQQQAKVSDNSAATEEAVSPPYPPPPPPPPSQRRPRVREVSSRFMSPVISSSSSVSSNSSSPLSKPHRSTSVQRPRQRHLDMEPLSCSDENRPGESVQIQSLENSPPWDSRCKASALPSTTHRKQRVKLFKENGGEAEPQHLQQTSKTYYGKIVSNAFPTPSRPDTPVVTSSVDRDRMMTSSSSRFRRSTNNSVTAAAKLLQSSGMSLPAQPSVPQDLSSTTTDDSNHNPLVNCSTRSLPDFRSSMPEADMLPTVSSRLLPEKNCTRGNVIASGDSFKFSASPCSRSMNLPLSGSEHSLFHPSKGSDKQAYALSNSYTNSSKMGALCLPPVPPCSKLGIDARKGRKVSTHQEDVHTLKMLHNRYLQWRYANAKAEATIQGRQRESERTLYSLMVKISELYASVKSKRIELGLLQRTKTLSTILETQIPYLEEWSALEEDYSISLQEAIQALLNASIQLPIGNVTVDTSEVGKALNSAVKVMEIILYNLQSFLPKAEDIECLISELARIIGGERALIEECGSLLSKTCTSQVEEFSLRGQIIQLHRCCHKDDRPSKK